MSVKDIYMFFPIFPRWQQMPEDKNAFVCVCVFIPGNSVAHTDLKPYNTI